MKSTSDTQDRHAPLPGDAAFPGRWRSFRRAGTVLAGLLALTLAVADPNAHAEGVAPAPTSEPAQATPSVVAPPALALAPLPAFDAPTPAERLAAARAAGDYLVRTQQPNGEFTYLYNPITDTISPTYNWLRHAGTIYSLCQLHAATGDARYLAAAERAAAALSTTFRPLAINGIAPLTVQVNDPARTGESRRTGPTVKAGGVALSMLALLSVDRRTGRPDHAAVVGQLARYLRWAAGPDGVPRSKYVLNGRHFDDWQSDYYPGQCLLAFATYLNDYPDADDAPANRLAMLRLMSSLLTDLAIVNDRGGDAPRAFDHWCLIGFATAFHLLDDTTSLAGVPATATEAARSPGAALALVVRYAGEEFRRQERAPGPSQGAFKPSTGALTFTSIRIEGIQAIAELVRTSPHPAAVARRAEVAGWAPALGLSHQFIMRCQFPDAPTPPGVHFAIHGAFRNSLDMPAIADHDIQIDYSQHAMSALLGTPIVPAVAPLP